MIEVGHIIPKRLTFVRPEPMRLWAKALRDPNPIHVDPQAARAAGLGDRVINQGPANVGYLVNALKAEFPNSRLEAIEVRFLDNVRGGDTAAASGSVVAATRIGSDYRLDCELQLSVEGAVALTATATIVTSAA